MHAGDSHPPVQVSRWLSGVCSPLWWGLGGPALSAVSRHEHHMWPADKQSGAGAEMYAGIPGSCVGTGRALAPLVAGRPLRAGANPAGWSLWARACLTGGHGHCPRVVLSKGCGPPNLDLLTLGNRKKGAGSMLRTAASLASGAGIPCRPLVEAGLTSAMCAVRPGRSPTLWFGLHDLGPSPGEGTLHGASLLRQ